MQLLCRLCIAICFFTTLTASAGNDKAQEVIDNIVEAYGGKALTSMKSLIVHDRYKTITKNGGVRPGLDAVSRLHSTLTVDFEQNKKSVKNWSVQARGKRLSEIMFDGKTGWSINYLRGSHVIRPDLNQNNVGAGMMRLLDTTVVRSLLDSKSTAMYEGTTTLSTQAHDKLSFKISGKTKVTLYVNKATGLISQMHLPNSTKYIYSEYRKTNGVTYASDTNQFRNEQAVMMTLSRSIEVNPNVATAFTLPNATKPLEGMRDNSKMTVTELSDGVYIAGLGNRSSLFVDAGNHFIGAGTLPGFKERLQAVNNKIKADKPAKYVIVPEHQGHMGGINEAAAMGADFVTIKSHLPSLKTQFNTPLPDERFVFVDGELNLAEGKVRVFDISTVTSDHFLLFYVPDAKLVYTMDEFGTNLLNSVPSADKRTMSFRQAIEALDIDVQHFTYVHGTGVLSLKQLQQITNNYKEGSCPAGHTICAD
ncbi:hypothetical protein [Flocculibacter collagenilyticus]|uniref:hypothetical protein n=1 Tax=Flocculibacter collagenilyticus TaxID=2744479 RepID=UPI0018F2FE3D|nr:hypothetical protein [Flocculibacter collagenilyticus]